MSHISLLFYTFLITPSVCRLICDQYATNTIPKTNLEVQCWFDYHKQEASQFSLWTINYWHLSHVLFHS